MSDKPTILVTRKLPQNVEARLAQDFEVRFNADDTLYTQEQVIELAQGCDGIIACHSEHFDRAQFERLPDSVKILAAYSVGIDWIDLDAAKDNNVVVTNTPDVLNDATAEVAILCMLGAARRASEGERMVRAAEWDWWSPAFMVGTQVTGKTLGVVGMGRVGRIVAKRAKYGFDMNIRYSNRSQLSPELEDGAIFHETVEDMLPHCDFLSLNCPATPDTIDLMNAERLALLPDGAILVNTSRGAVVDEDALIDALNSGKLAAAGLDVYKGEPGVNPKIAELTNTFLMPHIGSSTFETRDAMGFLALDNLDAFFRGKEPPTRVA
ncbi:MAG: D-glycerate dehydrogenase [Rhodospirillaceae bacterium]|jgi:lactate dehydrogenase-like 2-hydroxyacid dehydrogenase|nr:D-glycerate dehydrogenase [Rhodospirillales bacterium]MBT3906356.1 D-glycerate dehydrogenase [Rhodospirillaceae bacterium]MBT4701845.1 D-glycerate dehydrogenase [Rhodospirillaceae bacterium]MBT5036384.1 D-glycerate dehydrogenase [Rhodospirillaceae bacterium]MBT6222286.1 D-glycerate dehydrogenase [Rhodospirillaceae bacterium]